MILITAFDGNRMTNLNQERITLHSTSFYWRDIVTFDTITVSEVDFPDFPLNLTIVQHVNKNYSVEAYILVDV